MNSDASGSETMMARTLSDILTQCNAAQTIDLLKCDIEGAEREVFENAHEWIHRVQALFVELHAPYTVDEFLAHLQRAGARFAVLATNKSGNQTTLFLKQSPPTPLQG